MSNQNASPSLFGWHFQINTAIVFLLKSVKEIDSIRVEGEKEDIEINLSDGEKIFIQTKSCAKLGADSNAIAKLEEGLRTLFNASQSYNYKKLYFVTNYPNPLGGRQNSYHFFMGTGLIERNFLELPETTISSVSKRMKKFEKNALQFDKENFRVAVIPFVGDIRSSREMVIQENIKEFLADIHLETAHSKELLEIWQSDMFFNASQIETQVLLSKKKLMWPIVVLNCVLDEDDKYIYELESDYGLESEDIELILSRYKMFINKTIEHFDFVTRVIGDYKLHKLRNKGKNRMINFFVNLNWKQYEAELTNEGMEEEIAETLIKIILYKILNKQQTISKLVTGVNI